MTDPEGPVTTIFEGDDDESTDADGERRDGGDGGWNGSLEGEEDGRKACKIKAGGEKDMDCCLPLSRSRHDHDLRFLYLTQVGAEKHAANQPTRFNTGQLRRYDHFEESCLGWSRITHLGASRDKLSECHHDI